MALLPAYGGNTSDWRISDHEIYPKRNPSEQHEPQTKNITDPEYADGPRYNRSGEPYVNASPSLQALLHLDESKVMLNTSTDSATFEATTSKTTLAPDDNIPVEHRIYLTDTREDLLKKYIESIKGFKTAAFPLDKMTPYDRRSRDILFALNLTPGRKEDEIFLRGAFEKLHDFFLEYNHAMQEAVASHPRLRTMLRKVGSASI